MCKCSHFIQFSKTIEMTFPICVWEGYGAHYLNYQGSFLGTRAGGRFISAARLIILFSKRGKLSSCYHLLGMLVSFVSVLLAIH